MLIKIKSKKSEKIVVMFWALLTPFIVTATLSKFMDQPYNIFCGLIYLGFLSLLYRKIGNSRFETFKGIACFVLFLFLLSLGGWADQGIR